MAHLVVIDTNVLVAALLSKHSDAATVILMERFFEGESIPLYNADVTDITGAVDMMENYSDVTDHLSALKKIMADRGYTGEMIANTVKALSGVAVEVVKHNELHTFAVRPKR